MAIVRGDIVGTEHWASHTEPPPMELCVTMVPFALRGLGLLNVAYIKALVLMCFIFFTVAGTDDCATLVREVFFGGNFLM